jgi:hypothetical protein
VHVFSVLSPGLHDDDDDEYHSMFCCMIFGVSSAHGSLPVAPMCPIAINPIMRSGAGDLTSIITFWMVADTGVLSEMLLQEVGRSHPP